MSFVYDVWSAVKIALSTRAPVVKTSGRLILFWWEGDILHATTEWNHLISVDVKEKKVLNYDAYVAPRLLSDILNALEEYADFPPMRVRNGKIVPRRRGRPIRGKLWGKLLENAVATSTRESLDFLEGFFDCQAVFVIRTWRQTYLFFRRGETRPAAFYCLWPERLDSLAYAARFIGRWEDIMVIRSKIDTLLRTGEFEHAWHRVWPSSPSYLRSMKVKHPSIDKEELADRWENISKELQQRQLEVLGKLEPSLKRHEVVERFIERLLSTSLVARGRSVFIMGEENRSDAYELEKPPSPWRGELIVHRVDNRMRVAKLLFVEPHEHVYDVYLVGRDAHTGSMWSARVPPRLWLAGIDACRRWMMGLEKYDTIIKEV